MYFLSQFGIQKVTHAARKAEKLKKYAKKQNVSRLVKNVTQFEKTKNMLSTLRKTCHDGKNVTRFEETLIQLFVIQIKMCHDLLKT
jgi:hypothetical protein